MADYIIMHKYIDDNTIKINDYNVDIYGECKSAKEAILEYIETNCGTSIYELCCKAFKELTDDESIKLHNLIFTHEDEIVGVYEIGKEIYMKKNAFYLEEE